jgi:hypothetical protein
LDEVFAPRAKRDERHVQLTLQQRIESLEVLLVVRRYEEIPIHREPRHAVKPHGLPSRQQVTNSGRVERREQVVHRAGIALASWSNTDNFHAFSSAWLANRRLLKSGSLTAFPAGATIGLAAHSRYLAL